MKKARRSIMENKDILGTQKPFHSPKEPLVTDLVEYFVNKRQ